MAVYFDSLKVNNDDYTNSSEITAWDDWLGKELDFFLNCLDFWGRIKFEKWRLLSLLL